MPGITTSSSTRSGCLLPHSASACSPLVAISTWWSAGEGLVQRLDVDRLVVHHQQARQARFEIAAQRQRQRQALAAAAVAGTAAPRARSPGRPRLRRAPPSGARVGAQLLLQGSCLGGAHVRILQQRGSSPQRGAGCRVGGGRAGRRAARPAGPAADPASGGARLDAATAPARRSRRAPRARGLARARSARPRRPTRRDPQVAARPLSVCSRRDGRRRAPAERCDASCRACRPGRARRLAACARRPAAAAQALQRPAEIDAGGAGVLGDHGGQPCGGAQRTGSASSGRPARRRSRRTSASIS